MNRGRERTSVDIGIRPVTPRSSECASKAVVEQVGDGAARPDIPGRADQRGDPTKALIREMRASVRGVPADDVDPASFGLGGIGIIQPMTLAKFADAIAGGGGEVTGRSLYDCFATTRESIWPSGLPIECAKAEVYPSIRTFEFPVIEHTEDCTLQPVEGFDVVSAFEYLAPRGV